jgi:S1-C subfamily serine protease
MRNTVRRRLDLLLGLTLAGSVLACASTKPDAPSPALAEGSGEAGSAEHAAATARHGVLPNASVLENTHGLHAPNTEGLLRATQSGESSYDASAPATVLVTTRWGHGSGVVVDPRGLVLTNYHVIAAGQDENFQFRVKVTTVDIQKNGSVKPGPQYDAVALKVDPKRDLALLEIQGGPATLPVAPLAKTDPKPGRRVAAIGNAGVGFGWAVKHCSINAIGTLESRAEAIFHLHGETWSEQEREQMAEVIAKAAKDAGLQIQTDCTILPGDSGGPLIDEETHELVGLNVSVTSAVKHHQTLGSVAYHIHIAELREFIEDIPTAPVTRIPDPWEVAGSEGTLADSDGDGELDSLMILGACNESMVCHALFADVDQDSFRGGAKVPGIAEIYEQRAFDAEFVAFSHARLPRGERKPGGHVLPISDTLIYIDRNGDGALESLVVYDGETNEIRGFKGLDHDLAERDSTLDGRERLGAEVFDDAALGKRVERFADAFERPSHDPRAPAKTTAIEIRFDDHSGDARADTLYAQTRLDMRMLMDADHDSIATFADNAEAGAALAAGTIDAEFLAVNGTPMRVWYDTNDDGDFDLLLVGSSLDRGMVIEATSYTAGGSKPAPEHLGRRMLRPGLLADPADAATLERMFGDAFPQVHAAIDDGLSSFPSLTVHPYALVTEVEDSKLGGAHVIELDRVMVFADLDHDSFKPKAMKSVSLADALSSGRYEAEFVLVFDGIMAWAYYDSDNDGSFDTVLVSRSGDPLHAEEVFQLGAKLSWTTPSELTPMFDSARFASKKTRTAFTRFEQQVLAPEAVGEAR